MYFEGKTDKQILVTGYCPMVLRQSSSYYMMRLLFTLFLALGKPYFMGGTLGTFIIPCSGRGKISPEILWRDFS